jgi:hypothetical protein
VLLLLSQAGQLEHNTLTTVTERHKHMLFTRTRGQPISICPLITVGPQELHTRTGDATIVLYRRTRYLAT